MEIKVLDSIDYEIVGKLLYDSYIPKWGAAGSPKWCPDYIEYLDKTYIKPNGTCVGAFDGEKLVGIGFGYINNWSVMELGTITTMGICNFGIHPDHQRKGIATEMVKTLEEQAKKKGIKVIYRICNADLNDHLAFAKAGYTQKIDNAYQMARIMGKEMIDITATLKGMSKPMKLLLRAVAGFPKEKDKIEEGEIRIGTDADISACVKLLNAYKNSTEITQEWTEDEFARIIKNKEILKTKPFSLFYYVWDLNGEIKAFVVGRFEPIVYSAGIGTSAIIIHTGFAQELERKSKTSFVVSVLFEIQQKIPETFATNLAVAHHDEKAFDKAGFNNDRSTRPLYVKILDDSLAPWLQAAWKLKNYCIPYQR